MVDLERGYGMATKKYLPDAAEQNGVLLTDANELRRQKCPITLCYNLRLYNTTNKSDYAEPYPYKKIERDETTTETDRNQYRKKILDRVAIDSHRRKGSYKWLDSFETN